MKAVIISLFLSIIAISGCSGPLPKELINGHKIASTNAYNTYIIKDGIIIVSSNVTDVKVFGHYLIGKRIRPEVSDDDTNIENEKFGLFILDTKTGVLKESVSKDEIDILKSH